jgi:hypothetical protein
MGIAYKEYANEVAVFYRDMAAGAWDEKADWCKENLYHGGHYEPGWYLRYPWIEFDNEDEYFMFKLRWG